MTIYEKVFEAKKKFTAISKDQKNPHFNSAYYDINDLLRMVEPILHEQGLMILQPIKDGNITTIIIDVESGDKLEASHALGENPNPQKVGSEITYYRRYLLSSLLSLQADDDDGNKATDNNPKQDKPWLNRVDKQGNVTEQWENLCKAIEDGKVKSVDVVRKKYKVSKEVEKEIQLVIELHNI